MTLIKSNFFVLTGGPGVGKTTLIRHLRAEGLTCVDETARAVIREQVSSGGTAVPWGDTQAYFETVARRDLALFDAMAEETATVLFDRNLVDAACWALAEGITTPPDLIEALRARRCNPVVFVAPPWPEIYETDDERKQTWAEAEATFPRVMTALVALDYQPIVLPCVSVAERAAFVRQRMAEAGGAQVSTKARSRT